MTAAPKPEKRQEPGPWRAVKDTDGWMVQFVGKSGLTVTLGYGLTEETARLIAAAPAMLALLKSTRCPGGGWNGMPKELEGVATVKDCLTYGMCGCDYGDVVRKAEGR